MATGALLHFIISVSVYISSVSMATEEMGLASNEWRVYLDAIVTQTKLKSLIKQQADLERESRMGVPGD